MSVATDHELIDQARDGDSTAFDELVRRYQDKVFNAVLRNVGNFNDAQDLTQQTFLNAYRKLSDFQEQANLATWLYRIAFNLSVSFFRDRGRKRTVSLDAPVSSQEEAYREPTATDGDPAHAVLSQDMHEKIQATLALLDEESRHIVILREFESCAYLEIAQALSIPVGTVRSKLHRARLFLKEKLAGTFPRDPASKEQET